MFLNVTVLFVAIGPSTEGLPNSVDNGARFLRAIATRLSAVEQTLGRGQLQLRRRQVDGWGTGAAVNGNRWTCADKLMSELL